MATKKRQAAKLWVVEYYEFGKWRPMPNEHYNHEADAEHGRWAHAIERPHNSWRVAGYVRVEKPARKRRKR